MGGLGQLWEALAELWEALGELWEGLYIENSRSTAPAAVMLIIVSGLEICNILVSCGASAISQM